MYGLEKCTAAFFLEHGEDPTQTRSEFYITLMRFCPDLKPIEFEIMSWLVMRLTKQDLGFSVKDTEHSTILVISYFRRSATVTRSQHKKIWTSWTYRNDQAVMCKMDGLNL